MYIFNKNEYFECPDKLKLIETKKKEKKNNMDTKIRFRIN